MKNELSKRTVSKGNRLNWQLLSELENKKLNAPLVRGKILSESDLKKRRGYIEINDYLIP